MVEHGDADEGNEHAWNDEVDGVEKSLKNIHSIVSDVLTTYGTF